MDRNMPPQLIQRIEELIDASYSGRDELYAAAELLDDTKRSNVCKQLGKHLASHASELQQLLLVNGGERLEPLDMYSVAETYLRLAKRKDGESGVLTVAERCERTVKERFDEVLDETVPSDTTALLERQRDDIKFGEHVLRSMQDSPGEEPTNNPG